MARVPIKTRHNTRSSVREIIKAAELVELLQRKVLENQDIHQTWLRGVEILLRKALPDLTHVELHSTHTEIKRLVIDTGRGSQVGLAAPSDGSLEGPGGEQVLRVTGPQEVREDLAGDRKLPDKSPVM